MKIPEPKKLKSGTWFIQLRLTAPDGKRVSVPVSAATKKECIRAAELIKAEHRTGRKTVRPSGGETLGQLTDSYIEKRRNTISPSTIDGYMRIRENRFKSIMPLPVSRIKDWQSVINGEAALCSGKTLKNAWGLICSVLKSVGMAVPDVTLPQVISNSRPWLNYNEITLFLQAVKGKGGELPALLALHSLRRSELLALTWDNIDLSRGVIFVRGAVVQDEHHQFAKRSENKNVSSQRVVPIMIPRLRELLEAAPDKTGKLVNVSPHYVAQQINNVCRSAGLPEVGCHGLRHSFASLAHHVGMPEAECMRLGGWSDASTMRKIYTHIAELDVEKYSNLMASFYAAEQKG